NNCDCGTIEIYIRLSDLSDINLTEFDKASSKNESIYIDNRNNDTQLNCDQVIAVSPKVPSLSIHSEIPSQDLLGNFDRHSKISISSEKNKKAYIMTKSISSDFKVQYNHAESKNESVTNKSYRNESDSHGEVEIETFDNVMKNNNEKDLLHKLGSYSVDELNKKRIDSDKNSFLSERSHNKSKLSNTIVPPTKSLSKPSKVYSNVSNENDNISAKSRTTSENQSEKSVSKISKLSGYKSDIKDKKSTPNMSNKSDKSVKSTKSVIDVKKTHQISDNTVDNINNKDENGSEISEYSETKSKSKSKSKTNSKYSDKNSVNKSKISIDVNDADDVENKNYAKSNISTRTRSIHSSRESISSIEKTTEITESPLNVSPRINRRKTLQPSSGNITPSSEDENLNIHIVIHRLVISPDSYIMQNAKIKNVFVCYDLLDVLSEETETDLTLTKSSDNAMIYNFDKKYTYNQNDLENKKKLYNMIFVENKMVQFTVVSEPETDGECIDVAYGHVNLSDVLQSDKEIIEQPLKLYEIMDGESTNKVTATLYITVKCLKLLSWIKEILKMEINRKENFNKKLDKYFGGLKKRITYRDSINICNIPIMKLIDKIQNQELSKIQVLEAFQYMAILAHKETNCLVDFDFHAKNNTSEKIDSTKLLDGVPISTKDNIVVANFECTMGCPQFIGKFKTKNGSIAQTLIYQGAILFCRTNMSQIGYSYHTDNYVFGKTFCSFRNSKNEKLSSGGSSGGEGALISFGGSQIGIGTDVCGSVRIPAALCGICGLKPTCGRIGFKGPETSKSRYDVGIHFLTLFIVNLHYIDVIYYMRVRQSVTRDLL
ncbi:hypothetical protein A3Q56_06264, partial [Intoshia linei]